MSRRAPREGLERRDLTDLLAGIERRRPVEHLALPLLSRSEVAEVLAAWTEITRSGAR